ncbi:AdoMet-dependent rRNA methyltransferase SPB1 [Nematocida sp. LUAm3]|nr:AdoMet-dependent rRNA methyltransferase SPB1 [Nematocida sp. LUAm3]KAI5176180.1 AdoMet-dependent rRNA methyltransferase SPB1 [Nematocida sp. LUAm2]KAI5179274.1 AdoMet-dependent rRNA methyltransferase SPB1 [Nematocida sp. LUAm1]
MSVKKKTGKSRLDKYYFLAKDHGYRARSAFKLIQINQTYNVLSNVHSVVDLCAAPGGWLQVVSKAVRPPSKVIGVDLDPIRPIHGVETIVGDITHEITKMDILRKVDASEVDLVLHDGAPNVGTSWEKDSYVQNELVCHAAHLACQILKKNGTFITKVFRSKDFNSLVWMCNQLFMECLTTKPRSSREESAEVFLVCRGYKKPNVLDQRFFDPQFLFAEKDEEEKKEETLSNLLKNNLDLRDCTKIRIDCMEHMIDEETREMLSDLYLVGDMDKKRVERTIKKIRKAYLGKEAGNAPEEVMDMRTPLEKQEDEMQEIERTMKRREKISQRRILAKRTKKLGLTEEDVEEIEKIHGDFFEDHIFDTDEEEEIQVERDDPIEEEEEEEEEEEDLGEALEDMEEEQDDEEADSCSSSLDIEDKVCGYRLKKDEEEFENDGIDRYLYDDENLPQFFKNDEEKYNKRYVFNEDRDHLEAKIDIPKKQQEIKARRMRRIEKKIAKIKDRMEKSEQDVDLRAVRKSALKKETREKKRMVFAGPTGRVPRMKGRIKMTDKRMKKDKRGLQRAEEKKKRGKKRN